MNCSSHIIPNTPFIITISFLIQYCQCNLYSWQSIFIWAKEEGTCRYISDQSYCSSSLEPYRTVSLQSLEKNSGAHCSRAIMVITDGMPDIYKDIFDEYNWKTDMRVRMFTYLIGDEPEAHEMLWIACNNNGEKDCWPLGCSKIDLLPGIHPSILA